MKTSNILFVLLIAYLVASCNSNTSNNSSTTCCIDSFYYYFDRKVIGPQGFRSILTIVDRDLRGLLITSPRRLTYNFQGGIYAIDSLYFPNPLIDIWDFKDSSIVFDQDVFVLSGYSDLFVDSIMKKTSHDISIIIIDTLTKKKWLCFKCKD